MVYGEAKVYQEKYKVYNSETKLIGDTKYSYDMDDDEKKQKGIPTGLDFKKLVVEVKFGWVTKEAN